MHPGVDVRGRPVVLAIAIAALLGAGAALLLQAGPDSSPDDRGAEIAALRQQVRDLERQVEALASARSSAAPLPPPPTTAPPTRPVLEGAPPPPPRPSPGRDAEPQVPPPPVNALPFHELTRYAGQRSGQRKQSDPEIEARLAALRETAARDVDLAARAIRDALESRDEKDRAAARAFLRETREKAFLPTLTEIVNRRDPPEDVPSLLDTISRIKDRPWSAKQATGEPDTPIGGDLGTAWAPKQQEMGEVWLELDFEHAVRPEAVRVHETLAPGAVAKILAKTPEGGWVILWEGTAPASDAPTWFEPRLSPVRFATSSIRLVVDTDRVAGWNEIDAVELVGDRLRQWASDARAASSYSDP